MIIISNNNEGDDFNNDNSDSGDYKNDNTVAYCNYLHSNYYWYLHQNNSNDGNMPEQILIAIIRSCKISRCDEGK